MKSIGIAVIVLASLGLLSILYIVVKFPDVTPAGPDKVMATPDRIERGRYLANHVTVCIDCHSTRNWNLLAGPLVEGTLGKGGEKFDSHFGGVPGELYAKNITPAGIGTWTDGELMRCITNGVTKDNKAIFPLMPYLAYQHLSLEDLHSIVAYIRTLQPIENKVPESHLDFPMNLIVRTIPPKSYTPQPEPNKNNPLEYGKYLVQVAACGDCHTPADKGKQLPGMDYAGGFEFRFPAGLVRSANITPDPETGIGNWTKQQFISRFKACLPDSSQPIRVDSNSDFNTPMPWSMYAGLTREDLGAIYDYLRTIKPVKHSIKKFSPL